MEVAALYVTVPLPQALVCLEDNPTLHHRVIT